MTLHDLERQKNLMTAEERQEMLALGWQAAVLDRLFERGFRPCKADPALVRAFDFDPTRCSGWIRQTSMPHLHITVARDESLEVVLERIDAAIYYAGDRAGFSRNAGYFMHFLDQCRAWKPLPDLTSLEARVKQLEEERNDKLCDPAP